MFRSVLSFLGRLRKAVLPICVAWAICAGLSGCTSMDLRGDPFREDELSEWSRQFRTPGAEDEDYFVFSNKAKQVSRDLGGSRPLR